MKYRLGKEIGTKLRALFPSIIFKVVFYSLYKKNASLDNTSLAYGGQFASKKLLSAHSCKGQCHRKPSGIKEKKKSQMRKSLMKFLTRDCQVRLTWTQHSPNNQTPVFTLARQSSWSRVRGKIQCYNFITSTVSTCHKF